MSPFSIIKKGDICRKKESSFKIIFKRSIHILTIHEENNCLQTLPAVVLLFILLSIGRLLDGLLSPEVKAKVMVSSTGEDSFKNTQINHTHLSENSILLSRIGLLDFSLLFLVSSLFLLAKTSRHDPPTTLRRFA